MELIRANYPILIQVKLESPDGLTPAATLSGGIPAIQVPAEGNGVLDIPSDYAWTGYPKDLDRGYIESWNLTVQRELPWNFTGQIGYVATRTVRQLGLVDINAGQAIGAGDDGKPLLRRCTAEPRPPCSSSPSATETTTRCRRSCSGGSPTASASA